jgi:arylsulfatase A-like enzyme
MLHHKAPHRNWIPDEVNRHAFAERGIPEPATLFDTYNTRPAALPAKPPDHRRDLGPNDLKQSPPDGLAGDELVRWKYQHYMRDYLACVQGVDDQVGRLLDYLDTSGLAKNTVVFYTSDNGFFLGDLGLYDKRFMYEPSLRVPLLVRYPASPLQAPPPIFSPATSISRRRSSTSRVSPSRRHARSLSGPLLKGERPADWRTSMYYRYYHDPGDHNTRAHYGVRTATHKLIYYWKQDAWELFDLLADPNEQRNLAADPAHRETLESLKAELARLRKETKDEDLFAKEQPPHGVDGPFPQIPKRN